MRTNTSCTKSSMSPAGTRLEKYRRSPGTYTSRAPAPAALVARSFAPTRFIGGPLQRSDHMWLPFRENDTFRAHEPERVGLLGQGVPHRRARQIIFSYTGEERPLGCVW